MYAMCVWKSEPRSAAATTEIAPWPPLLASVVPSIGSTATSILGPSPVADLFADVEHRRFVFLAFADDDEAVDVDFAEHAAHRVDGRLVDRVLVAPPDELARDDRRRFGRAQEFELDARVDPPSCHALP